MNLLSDLSSELAMAILVENEHSGKVSRGEGVKLIGKVCDALRPISDDDPLKEPTFAPGATAKSSGN